MENKIGFNPKWLKAAALIAARNDIRYYLNGVLVEVFEHEARLVATDGHRMAILRKLNEDSSPIRFIVPVSVFSHLRPSRAYRYAEASFSYDPAKPNARITMEYLDIGIQFTPIDGKYPDYAQTMNKAATPSGERATINVTYLHDFKRVVDMAFGSDRLYTPSVWHNGEGPAAVTYKGHEDFFGIVMPMRDGFSYKPLAWTLPEQSERKEQEEARAA